LSESKKLAGLWERMKAAWQWLWRGSEQVRLDRLLDDECQTAPLRAIADDIRGRPHATSLTREQIIEQVGDLARAHYVEMWKAFTQPQKLAFVQLAQEGLVNPRNWDLMRGAHHVGLVRRSPAVRLMNESFRRFVATVEDPKTIADWEAPPEAGSTGLDTRTVAGTLFVAAATFMLLTQPDVFNGWVGIATGVAGGVPVFTKLFGFFGKPTGDVKPSAA
jgi:hypothetical protein